MHNFEYYPALPGSRHLENKLVKKELQIESTLTRLSIGCNVVTLITNERTGATWTNSNLENINIREEFGTIIFVEKAYWVWWKTTNSSDGSTIAIGRIANVSKVQSRWIGWSTNLGSFWGATATQFPDELGTEPCGHVGTQGVKRPTLRKREY